MPDNRTFARVELSSSVDQVSSGQAGQSSDTVIARQGAIVEAARGKRLVKQYAHQAGNAGRERPPFQVDQDLITLFYAVDAMKSDDEPYVLQFVASTPQEGTSTIAWGFAIAASLERNQSVLIVDCNADETPSGRVTLIDAANAGGLIDDAIESVPQMKRLFRAKLSSGANPMLEIDGADLRDLLGVLKDAFSVVVLDCPAAKDASDSLAISRYCDGTILVVRAEHARPEVVSWTKEKIERFGGHLIGAVLNDRKKYIPDWLYRHI